MEQFEKHRRTLFLVAYKMTKSVVDAEDILQDVFVAISQQPLEKINDIESYLVKSVMNRCLTLLEKQKYIVYPGVDLPAPLFNERFSDIQDLDISYALIFLLQKLNPIERAIFILRETFDYEYSEIGDILVLNEANCRQILHRAKTKITTGKARNVPSQEKSTTFINTFIHTCLSGDTQQLISFLKEDITIYSDGGGKVSAARHPIVGKNHCIAFLMGLHNKFKNQLSLEIATINGESGIILYSKLTGIIDTIMLMAFEGDIVSTIYFIRNPDKIMNCK